MSLDDNIHAYFVTTGCVSNTNNDKFFATAQSMLRSHIPENNIRQIKASEGYALIASDRLTKRDVFILDCFEGDFFKQLQQTKSLIVGPPCIVSCLLSCTNIPLGVTPVFTTAMRDLRVTTTSLTAAEKERIRTLVHWMGGHCFNNLGSSITHLISNTIKSNKYEHATLNGIPVMHVDWVQKVWERSCDKENVCATDDEFEKFRLPIFYGTNITCTGLDTDKKNRVMRIVNENGGTYHRAFRSQLVDIVITEQSQTHSEKYKAALRFNKDILEPEWIFESERKGYAVPTKEYIVKAHKEVSTPTKVGVADSTQLSDISRISYVSGGPRMCSDLTTVNETLSSTLNTSTASSAGNGSFAAPVAPKSAKEMLKKATKNSAPHYRVTYDEISMREAKKAGSFLDGCSIYLSGFQPEEHEKLNRILNAGGATRYDAPNEDVTHIIIGKLDDAEFRHWQKDGLLSSVHVVRLQWLQESIKSGHLVSEANYRVKVPNAPEPDAPSPSSKRTLRSMNHSFKRPERPIKKKLFTGKDNAANESIAQTKPVANSTELPLPDDAEDEQRLIAQYSQEYEAGAALPAPSSSPAPMPMPALKPPQIPPTVTSTQLEVAKAPAVQQPEATLSMMSSIDYDKLDYFQGAAVYIDKEHFTGELYTQVLSECEAADGNVVSQTFADPVDYAIVSFEQTYDVSRLPVKARHIITELYVESCLKDNKLVPIEYFHKHIPHTADSKPLVGMIIVVSIYSGLERDFIDSIGQLLGAQVHKTYIKKENPLLICPSPEGSKYEGAIKWGYPVVNSQWLVQCAETGEKLPYQSYLVGDSVSDFSISPSVRESSTKTRSKLDSTPRAATNVATPVAPTIPAPAAAPMLMETGDLDAVENIDVAAAELTPLRNRRVSELVAGGMGSARGSSSVGSTSPVSPHTPLNSLAGGTYNFDFMEGILEKVDNEEHRQCLRDIINEMRQNQTPEYERFKRQACTPINGKTGAMRTPKGIPDFCLTPEFKKRMADDFERRWRLSTKKLKPDTPIDVIRQRILRITCETLGVAYDVDNGDDTLDEPTGSVQKVQQPLAAIVTTLGSTRSAAHVTPSAAVPTAKAASSTTPLHRKSLIATRTLFAGGSADSLEHNDGNTSDTFVPATQSPNASGNHLATAAANSSATDNGAGAATLLGKSTINFDKISFEDTNNASSSTHLRPSTIAGANDVNATTSPELKQITDYLKDCESRRRSLKRTHSGHSYDRVESASSGMDVDVEDLDSEAQYVQPFESEQFYVGTEEMVGWRDPGEWTAARNVRTHKRSMQYAGKPRFSISSSNETEQEDIIHKIQQLGGEVCEKLSNYDPSCTHYICERPNRGEKMLGCIASGKWTLTVKYIEESYAKDCFLDEELFEWGNTKAVLNLPHITPEEQVIAVAAHRWRHELQQHGGNGIGAFSEFRAILSVAERSVEAIKAVIKAGSGEVIDAKSPYGLHNDAQRATHCFVDAKKAPLKPHDIRFLQEHGVAIMSQIYINAFLMNGRDFDYQKYQLYAS